VLFTTKSTLLFISNKYHSLTFVIQIIRITVDTFTHIFYYSHILVYHQVWPAYLSWKERKNVSDEWIHSGGQKMKSPSQQQSPRDFTDFQLHIHWLAFELMQLHYSLCDKKEWWTTSRECTIIIISTCLIKVSFKFCIFLISLCLVYLCLRWTTQQAKKYLYANQRWQPHLFGD
jgi:hypothetical protein